MMNNTANEELLARLREFFESEMRSCSMDLAGITPEYVQRMWGGTVSLEDIEKALREQGTGTCPGLENQQVA